MENCSICASDFKNPCTLPCNHRFCSVCIATWFTRSASCPLCRCDCTEWAAKWAQTEDAPLVIQMHYNLATEPLDDFTTEWSLFSEDIHHLLAAIDDEAYEPVEPADPDELVPWYYQTESERVMFNNIAELLS